MSAVNRNYDLEKQRKGFNGCVKGFYTINLISTQLDGGRTVGKVFEAVHKVRSYECDSYGHVNNAVYLNYLEYGRMEALDELNITLERLKTETGTLVVIRRVDIEYLRPLTMGDEIVIKTFLKESRRTSGVFGQEIIHRESGELAARADVTWVFINLQGKPAPIPQLVKEGFGIP